MSGGSDPQMLFTGNDAINWFGGWRMKDQDELSDCKDENKELLAIVADYIHRYGLTLKARKYFERLATQKLDGQDGS